MNFYSICSVVSLFLAAIIGVLAFIGGVWYYSVRHENWLCFVVAVWWIVVLALHVYGVYQFCCALWALV